MTLSRWSRLVVAVVTSYYAGLRILGLVGGPPCSIAAALGSTHVNTVT